ncbi:ABC transporter ATP-binding protein [Patescibacteria group bacterium]|nr:ABC transporter ATP-binding protein [Patescibacteria group bacterium]MBU4057619.1 ABC transporter ATP-binding protein [Patescibacteria group bacterium]MBU4115769.1 ABC transporter ATP-binding protein [Patescibacteria group bacterium]
MTNSIEIKNIGKKYNITHQRGSYVSLRDVITNILKNPFKHAKHKAKQILGKIENEEFWALKDINLTIKKGEIIGIIGANGAGKSTLLKLLSRITPPTTGEIKLSGRVASLLEVGTGFHPELTGRENIFLNGAILGMTKKEIVERFDDIVEFSGVKQFLDTPVKRYSSGMYVRLAFAVAAHMEPDILIVDEVLAVGDAEFQKKSLGKLDEVSKSEGRTILFVSHNMAAIQKLCKKTILLEKGRIEMFGDTEKVVDHYVTKIGSRGTEMRWEKNETPGDDVAILHSARIINENRDKIPFATANQKIGVEFVYEVLKDGYIPIPNIHIFTPTGERAFMSHEEYDKKLGAVGKHRTTMWIPENLLNDGTYVAQIVVSTMKPLRIHLSQQEALVFSVVEDIMNSQKNDFNQKVPGVVRPRLKWETVQF